MTRVTALTRLHPSAHFPGLKRAALKLVSAFVLIAGALAGAVRPAAAQVDVFSLDGLVVTAAPNAREEEATASHVSVLDGEQLRALGFRSLADALRDVAGLHVVRGGSFGATTSVFLRGGESDYTLVLVDGVQVNQAGGGFDFAGLTTDNVERVEIVRGPASALYGSDAVAGVIHVITRVGRGAPTASLSYEGGTFGRQDWAADFQAGTDRAGYSVSASRRTSDGILDFNNGSVNTTVSGLARIQPDDRTDVQVALRISDREYQFPTDGSGAVVDENAFTFEDGVTTRLSVMRTLSDVVSVEALIGLNQTNGGTDDAPDSLADTLGFYAFSSLNDFKRATGEVRANVDLGGGLLTAGYEYEQERQRSFTESLSSFGPFNARSESERRNHAGYLHATGAFSTLAFNAGSRLEDNQRFGRFLTWQLGAAWAALPSVGTLVRASIGTAIKEPTFFENFATGFAVGNPDLDPERAFSWEFGVEQPLLANRLRLSVTFFDQSYEDLIQFTFAPPDPGDPNFFNIAAATSRGLELDGEFDLGPVSAGGTWTWLDTEVTDSGFDSGEGAAFVKGEALLRRPGSAFAFRVGTSSARVDIRADLSIVGERSDRDFSTFPATPIALAGYTLLAIGGEWRVTESREGRPGFAVQLRAENLLAEDYQEVFGFGAPGRALYLGGRVSFGGRPG
jgi:vitamin B12 transporter